MKIYRSKVSIKVTIDHSQPFIPAGRTGGRTTDGRYEAKQANDITTTHRNSYSYEYIDTSTHDDHESYLLHGEKRGG